MINAQNLKNLTWSLGRSDSVVKPHVERLKEMEQTKREMQKFQELRSKFRFYVKKERLLRNHHRHGILGINKTQDAIPKDHFYSKEEALVKMQKEKAVIRRKRAVKLQKYSELCQKDGIPLV